MSTLKADCTPEVALVVFVGLYLDGHILHDLQSVGFEAHALDGIVGEEAHLVHAELAEYLRAHAVVPLVGVIAEVDVGVDGVIALLLELVGGDLGHESYAAALLIEVEHYALALPVDHLHGAVQLLAAVAAARTEDVARGA